VVEKVEVILVDHQQKRVELEVPVVVVLMVQELDQHPEIHKEIRVEQVLHHHQHMVLEEAVVLEGLVLLDQVLVVVLVVLVFKFQLRLEIPILL
tara:strand:- start:91 stop:372 length:282 start_codon:yes stop_codon:yes gene_type:complete